MKWKEKWHKKVVNTSTHEVMTEQTQHQKAKRKHRNVKGDEAEEGNFGRKVIKQWQKPHHKRNDFVRDWHEFQGDVENTQSDKIIQCQNSG